MDREDERVNVVSHTGKEFLLFDGPRIVEGTGQGTDLQVICLKEFL